MWWLMASQAALSWLNAGTQNRISAYNNATEALRTKLSNQTRTVANAATAAQNSLSRWMQSVNNQRVLQAGGEAFNANQQTALRSADSRSNQWFSTSLSDAEQMGAQAAGAAFSGAAGESVHMVNVSTKLRQDMVREQLQTAGDYASNDLAQRAGQIMSQTIGGLDNSVILDRFDNHTDVARQEAMQSPWRAALGAVLPYAAKAVSSFASSPDSVQPKLDTSLGTLSLTQRWASSSTFDLADQAYKTGSKFGFSTNQDAFGLGAQLKI